MRANCHVPVPDKAGKVNAFSLCRSTLQISSRYTYFIDIIKWFVEGSVLFKVYWISLSVNNRVLIVHHMITSAIYELMSSPL